MPTFALNFSRPGGQIVAQYYNFLRLGREGYRKIHAAAYARRTVPRGRDRASWARSTSSTTGAGGIPALSWKLREGVGHGFTLFDLADRLRVAGWQVPAYTLPANREDLADPAHPGAPRLQPGHGRPPARRLPARHRAPRRPPAHHVDVRARSQRIPPLTARAVQPRGSGPTGAPLRRAPAGSSRAQRGCRGRRGSAAVAQAGLSSCRGEDARRASSPSPLPARRLSVTVSASSTTIRTDM